MLATISSHSALAVRFRGGKETGMKPAASDVAAKSPRPDNDSEARRQPVVIAPANVFDGA